MKPSDNHIYSISIIDGKLHTEENKGEPDDYTIIDLDTSTERIDITHAENLLARATKEELEEILTDEVLHGAILSEKISIPVFQDDTAFTDW